MKIEHVAMFVEDLDGAKAFFEQYFKATANTGYHNKQTGFKSYFLTFDDGARLEIMSKPQTDYTAVKLERAGYVHIAFSVGRKEKVDELSAQLQMAGYKVESGPRTTGDGYYESSVIAIEGNQIEITV